MENRIEVHDALDGQWLAKKGAPGSKVTFRGDYLILIEPCGCRRVYTDCREFVTGTACAEHERPYTPRPGEM
jgi:hypothetical protein